MCTPAATPVRELDRRTNDGFDVRLLWNSQTSQVFVAVEDQRHGNSFEFEVEAADALEAFRHPFAYADNDRDARSLSLSLERSPGQPRRGKKG
jgi:hypothetical protein